MRSSDLPKIVEGGHSAGASHQAPQPLGAPSPSPSWPPKDPGQRFFLSCHGKTEEPSPCSFITVVIDPPRIAQCVSAGQILKVHLC